MIFQIRIAFAMFAMPLTLAAATPVFAEEYGTQASEVLPPEFRGTITYNGRHEGEVTTAAKAPNSLSLRSILRSVTGGKTVQHSGTFNVELTFNGNQVTGRYWGTGGIKAGTYKGNRTGDRCRLVDSEGFVREAECTRGRFALVSTSEQGRNATVMRIDAMATQIVDTAVEDQQAAASRTGNTSRGLQHTGMARCWAFGFAAPTSQEELEKIPTNELLKRAEVMGSNNDQFCSSLYSGEAAKRGNIQAMAWYAYGFSSDMSAPDPKMEAYWCQKAYRGARTSKVQHDLDTVNYFCPIETIAVLMTPTERKKNQESVDRAAIISGQIKEENVARGNWIWNNLLDVSPGGLCSGGQSTDSYTEGNRTVTVRCN